MLPEQATQYREQHGGHSELDQQSPVDAATEQAQLAGIAEHVEQRGDPQHRLEIQAAIDLALATLDRLNKDSLDATTIESAKQYIAGQFAPSLETAPQLARTLVDMTLHGDSRDTIDGYLGKVAAATPAQIAEARNVFAPSQDQVLVVIGNASRIHDVIKAYGPMTEMKITDPRFNPAP